MFSVATWRRNFPYVLTAGVAAAATAVAPALAGPTIVTGRGMKYAVQGGTAIIGGALVGRFLGRAHGMVWAITGLGVIAADLVTAYIIGPWLGLADYEVSAFPTADAGLGAGAWGTLDDGGYAVDAFPDTLSDAYPSQPAY